MATNRFKELVAARAKLAALEAQITAGLNKELVGLPAKYGFADADAFLEAFAAANGTRGKRRGPTAKAAGAAKPARRKRMTITDEIREQVKKLVEAGKTGAEISKEVGVSLPSVQNIKKALGLVKKGKK